jgi:hypothetical protein
MPDTIDEQQAWTTTPLEELRANLEFARNLVGGGGSLEQLEVKKFEVDDMYRAAWVQAVSALDQWVYREIFERALGLVLNADEPRPAKFLKLQIPMSMFEDLYHHSGSVEKAFAAHLRDYFRFQSFQSPDRIKEGFRHVSTEPIWQKVAAQLANDGDDGLESESDVVECLRRIVHRRNNIAHAADRDPEDGTSKLPISAAEVTNAIGQIERIIHAIADVLGPLPSTAHVGPVVGASSKQDLYLRFWSEFKPVVERHGWTKAQPQPQNWWNMPAGVTGTTWALSFSRFGCRSELYFEHPDPAVNLARWQVLDARRDEIVARFGGDLIFDELPQNKGCRIETRLLGVTVEHQGRWPFIRDWMEASQARLRAAVAAVGGVPSVMG